MVPFAANLLADEPDWSLGVRFSVRRGPRTDTIWIACEEVLGQSTLVLPLLRQIYGLIDSRPIGRGERATGGVGPLGLTECLKEIGKTMVGA